MSLLVYTALIEGFEVNLIQDTFLNNTGRSEMWLVDEERWRNNNSVKVG